MAEQQVNGLRRLSQWVVPVRSASGTSTTRSSDEGTHRITALEENDIQMRIHNFLRRYLPDFPSSRT